MAQYPEGPTVHRVFVRRADGLEQVHEFSGATRPGDWLVFIPPTPLDGVTAVRVDTPSSPSWVAWSEIEAYGEGAP